MDVPSPGGLQTLGQALIRKPSANQMPRSSRITVVSTQDIQVLARFRDSRPRVTWIIWLVFVAANLADVLWRGRDKAGLILTLILLAVSLLIWQLDVRPQVLAFRDRLEIRGGYRDIVIPWGEITEFEAGPSLVVHTSAGAFRSPAIAAKLGELYRVARPGAPRTDRVRTPKRTVVDYAANELESMHYRLAPASAPGPVRITWRFAELAALAVALIALVLVIVVL
jgi:hypothetical protein